MTEGQPRDASGTRPGRWRAWVPDTFGRRLALVTLGALVLRLAYLALSHDWAVLGDGVAYRIESLRLVDEQVVQGPLHPPAWTFVVALPPALGMRSQLSQQLLTVLIGTAAVAMVGIAGRAAFDRRVGLVAAAIAAVYPGMWLYEREIVSEPLALLGVATVIWATYRFLATPSLARAVGLGALVGLLALTRSELLAYSIVVMAAVLGRQALPIRQRLAWLALAGATAVLVLAPWTAYNSTRYENVVVLSTGLGPAMRAGNCERTHQGELLGYYVFGCIIFTTASDDPSVADGQLREAALRFMGEDPGRTVVVSVARVGRTFNVFRPFQQVDLETERGTPWWVTAGALAAYWVLMPLAVGGAVLARRRGVPIYPLLAIPLIVAVAVLPTIGSVRYRAPADVPLVILAATCLVHLLDRRRAAGA